MSVAHPPTPTSQCRNCGAPIHRPTPDFWVHDGVGTRRCDGVDRDEPSAEAETAQPDPLDAFGNLGDLLR